MRAAAPGNRPAMRTERAAARMPQRNEFGSCGGGDTAIFLISQRLLTYVAPPFQFPPKIITKTFKSYTIGAELKGDAVAANK